MSYSTLPLDIISNLFLMTIIIHVCIERNFSKFDIKCQIDDESALLYVIKLGDMSPNRLQAITWQLANYYTVVWVSIQVSVC